MVSGVTGLTPPPAPFTTFPWKRNLAVLWVAQIATSLGFSFTFPFFPIFFQELGIEPIERAAFWAGLGGWVLGIGMALFAPLWGIIGDRFGRKINIVRAMMLAAIILAATGYAQTPGQLIFARFMSGAATGIVPAIMALVASHTPRERLAFATGATQSALFLGMAIGPLFGGLIFDHFGMRAAFWATGGALGGAGLLVALLAREEFHRPDTGSRHPLKPFADLWKLTTTGGLLPLLLVLFFVHGGLLLTAPALPGVAAAVQGGMASATETSYVFMAMGAAAAASAAGMGWVAGRFGPQRVFVVGAALAALAGIGPLFAGSLVTLAFTVGVVSLFQGGLAGLANGLIALRAPPAQQGAAFGAAQVSHSLGMALGPLAGGAAAVTFGLHSVFVVNVGLLATVSVLAAVLLAPAKTRRPTEEERHSPG